MYMKRVNRLIENLSAEIEYYLLLNHIDIGYLTGFFDEEICAVVDRKLRKIYILCDARITKMAQDQSQYGEVLEYKKQIDVLQAFIGSIGVYEGDISMRQYLKWEQSLVLQLLSENPITSLRQQKNKYELDAIFTSCKLIDRVMKYTISTLLKVGISEKHCAWNIEKYARDHGAEAMSFHPIVAFGDHSSSPHHQNTNRKLEVEMPVLLDMGCMLDGYASDLTRSFWYGARPISEYVDDWNILYATQQEAIASIAPGCSGKKLDQFVRNQLKAKDKDQYFTHSLGHGVGLDVHDPGSLSQHQDWILHAGACFTIEPGIYKLKKYGIRIEDTVSINLLGHTSFCTTSPYLSQINLALSGKE